MTEEPNLFLARIQALEAENAELREEALEWKAEWRRSETQSEWAQEELKKAQAENTRLREAISGLLLAADASWEENDAGHDWPAACAAARSVYARSAPSPLAPTAQAQAEDTDLENPAWWRGEDYGVKETLRAVTQWLQEGDTGGLYEPEVQVVKDAVLALRSIMELARHYDDGPAWREDLQKAVRDYEACLASLAL
jgi:hypothetical protein